MKFRPGFGIGNRASLGALLAPVVLIVVQATPATAATLTVNIAGVHPGAGSVRVALYADADSFRHEERAVRVLSVPAGGDTASVVFGDVKPGRYAVVAYHDANDDKKLNLFLGMFPKEGWGLSNNPRVVGPPRFEPSAFDVAEPNASALIWLHY